MTAKKQKIIAILGPTSSGKSSLAVHLARKFNGEIVSADSRQVYEGLDIGSGKITKKEMRGVPHHLLDVASPRGVFTVAKFKKKAERAINDILKRGKLPILCGGTGFYIQAVVDDIMIPEVPPNKKLREQLEKKTAAELFKILKKLDARRAMEIDKHNPRRLIRAIEIVKSIGFVPRSSRTDIERLDTESKYDTLQIGIKTSDKELKEKIRKRLLARISAGMIDEARNLHKSGLSWKRMRELGLEYRFLALHLTGELSKKDMVEELNCAIWKYARRQKTWFRKNKKIKWFNNIDKKIIEKAVKEFLN